MMNYFTGNKDVDGQILLECENISNIRLTSKYLYHLCDKNLFKNILKLKYDYDLSENLNYVTYNRYSNILKQFQDLKKELTNLEMFVKLSLNELIRNNNINMLKFILSEFEKHDINKFPCYRLYSVMLYEGLKISIIVKNKILLDFFIQEIRDKNQYYCLPPLEGDIDLTHEQCQYLVNYDDKEYEINSIGYSTAVKNCDEELILFFKIRLESLL